MTFLTSSGNGSTKANFFLLNRRLMAASWSDYHCTPCSVHPTSASARHAPLAYTNSACAVKISRLLLTFTQRRALPFSVTAAVQMRSSCARLRLAPYDVLAHPPAGVLQRDSQPVRHHDQILRLQAGAARAACAGCLALRRHYLACRKRRHSYTAVVPALAAPRACLCWVWVWCA